MARKRERIYFEQGWADCDPERVEIGDRAIPRRVEATFPSTEDRWPALHLVIEARAGVPQCVELTLKAHPEGREVRDVDFRHIRLEDWVETITAEAAMEIVTAENGARLYRKTLSSGERSAVAEDEARRARKTISQARQGARRRVTDDLLRNVGKVYRSNVPGKPVEAVAAAYATSHRTAARYVQLARKKGFLPPTTQGKVSR